MNERKYKVILDDVVIAENMNLETSIILINAVINHYYEEHSMTISIREMERPNNDECIPNRD